MTPSIQPKVDVILTCYNEGDHIGFAIRSILEQSCSARIGRIVIADDGSQPGTISVLQEIEAAESRLSVIYGPGGAGPAEQRNRAIAATDAHYVAILDADDYWTPEKLERQLPLLDNNPQIGLVYSDYYAFSDGNPEAARQAGAADLSGAKDLCRTYFLRDPPILPSTVILRREAFDHVGGFDASIYMFEETDLWFRLARICSFGFSAAPLLYKRYHARSLTSTPRDLMPDHAFIAMKAVGYDPALLGLVPLRLSERARKLGNHRFLQGDSAEAARLLHQAIQLYPLNFRAWPSWVAAALLPGLSNRVFNARLRKRRQAIGVKD